MVSKQNNPYNICVNFGHYVMELPNNTKSLDAPLGLMQQLQTTYTDPVTLPTRNIGISQ
jgi:hypothetical protein